MKIVVNLIYDQNDRVSCPNRKRFSDALPELMDTFIKLYLNGSVKDFDVSCFSMNLKENQYCETQKR